jgi:hypothetical protein
MTDKTRHRHRHLRAPQGYLPNWVVAALAIGAAMIGVLLQHLG